jgi:putative transposase
VLTQHGVKVAPRTYYAAKARPAWARALRDTELVETIRAVHADRAKGRGMAGYRKVWHLLQRDGVTVARCTVARLMRQEGLHGAVRGRRFRTTIPDPATARPADLVRREFHAAAPSCEALARRVAEGNDTIEVAFSAENIVDRARRLSADV